MIKSFTNWFVGFVDGEGCFSVVFRQPTKSKKRQVLFRFSISQRERRIIEAIKNELKFGRVRHTTRKEKNKYARNGQIMSTLTVTKREDLLKIIQLFTKSPLRSRKNDSFLRWKKFFEEFKNRSFFITSDEFKRMLKLKKEINRHE